MTDLDPPNPQLVAAAQRRLRRGASDHAEAGSLAAYRANAEPDEADLVLDPDLHYQSVDVDGVSADWVWAEGVDRTRVVLYAHGGGFVAGSTAMSRLSNGLLARASGVPILSMNYALAPEFPFPAGLEDIMTGYRWLLAHDYSPDRVAFSGTSAGGTLVLAALHAARNAAVPLPAAVAVLNPLTDFTAIARMGAGARGDRMSGAYLAGHDPAAPTVSPALGQLAGLPPLHIEVGTADPFLFDNRAFVARARAAGVTAELHETVGGVHSFLYVAPYLPESRHTIDRMARFIDKHLVSIQPE